VRPKLTQHPRCFRLYRRTCRSLVVRLQANLPQQQADHSLSSDLYCSIYGGSVPYRNSGSHPLSFDSPELTGISLFVSSVCRFNSGWFYRHPLMMKYRYYWRVEPSVRFFCDIRYDPFLTMMDEKKVYGQFPSSVQYPGSFWKTSR
jgi:hypothetical protein